MRQAYRRPEGRETGGSGYFEGVAEMKHTLQLGLALLLALAFCAAAASAGTDRIPVAAAIVGYDQIAAGDQIVTGNGLDGTLQFRDVQDRQYWDGDRYLAGTAVVTYDVVAAFHCVDLFDCKVTGRLWGKITMQPNALPNGGWDGTFSFKITSLDQWGFSYSGKEEAKGYGDLGGMRLRLDVMTDATIPPWDVNTTATGYVLTHEG
jgi:hypothetical protein